MPHQRHASKVGEFIDPTITTWINLFLGVLSNYRNDRPRFLRKLEFRVQRRSRFLRFWPRMQLEERGMGSPRVNTSRDSPSSIRE